MLKPLHYPAIIGRRFKNGRWGILFAVDVLYKQNILDRQMMQAREVNPDRAYSMLLKLLPVGLKGLAFGALTAAVVVASLAGKANSIATIFRWVFIKKNCVRKLTNRKWCGTPV